MEPLLRSACLLLIMLLVMTLGSAVAPKKANRKSKAEACRYDRTGDESPCNSTSNTRMVTVKLKKGNIATCQPTKVVTKLCHDTTSTKKRKVKGCRYERKGSEWTDCDTSINQMSKVMNLKNGSSPHCPPTSTKTKSCGSNNKKESQRPRKDCVYKKQPWSGCDLATKTRQREMVLVKGERSVCLPKKIVTKVCKKECRYTRGEWGLCSPATNLRQRPLTPKRDQPIQCAAATVETRPCRNRAAELVAAKSNKCRYNMSEWSPCDLRSNTMTQWMTLKSGDPNVCQRSKKLTKKCRTACKFRRGEWSECVLHTHLTTRVDTLVKGSHRECDLTREITKKCKRVCKYSIGDWGTCDPVTNHRTRVKKLIDGDLKKCRAEEIVTKPCTKKDGEERCFFGPWGDFGPCTNGVMTKHRPVLQGGVECERKGVITKACDKNS